MPPPPFRLAEAGRQVWPACSGAVWRADFLTNFNHLMVRARLFDSLPALAGGLGEVVSMQTRTPLITFALLLAAGLTLAACDPNEQDRVRNYEPGVYKGQADTQLTEQQREALRRRMSGQSGS